MTNRSITRILTNVSNKTTIAEVPADGTALFSARRISVAALAVISLIFLAQVNYLFAHVLAETWSIMVAAAIFVFASQTFRFSKQHYLLILGYAYITVACLDLLHTFFYSGMGIFETTSPNQATQLWVAARGIEVLSLLLAPFLAGKKPGPPTLSILYGTILASVLCCIFVTGTFPVCFIDGTGLTTFKITAEYSFCILLLLALYLTLKSDHVPGRRMRQAVILSIAFTILSELCFTLYSDVYDISNILGHCFKALSFMCIYLGILLIGIQEPYLRQAMILEAVQDGMFDINFAEENCIYSRHFKQLLGYADDEDVPASIDTLLNAADETARKTLHQAIICPKQNSNPEKPGFFIELHAIRKDGSRRWLLCRGRCLAYGHNGQPLRVLGTIKDIERRKQTEQELEERLRFETLTADLSAVFTTPQTSERAVSQALEQLADFLKVDICALIEPQAKDQTLQALFRHTVKKDCEVHPPRTTNVPWYYDQLLHGKIISTTSSEDLLPPEGEIDRKRLSPCTAGAHYILPLVFSGQTYALLLGQLEGEHHWPEALQQRLRLIGEVLIQSVKLRKNSREMHLLREEISHISRVNQMGQLAASIAHEINQPLAAILSNSQAGIRLLKQEPIDLVEVDDLLHDVANDSHRAGEVISRMRAMLRRDTGTHDDLDINQMISGMIRLLKSEMLAREIEVIRKTPSSPIMIHGDRVQLQQVLLNLMMNAAEAMQQSPPHLRSLVIDSLQTEHQVEIRVADKGSGLSPDELDHVFKPFYTTKGEGMGMGLAICNDIIQSHGGTLWASNNANDGCTFHFSIPLTDF